MLVAPDGLLEYRPLSILGRCEFGGIVSVKPVSVVGSFAQRVGCVVSGN